MDGDTWMAYRMVSIPLYGVSNSAYTESESLRDDSAHVAAPCMRGRTKLIMTDMDIT